MTVPFMNNFRSLPNKFVQKWKPKLFGSKNVMERGISKILTFVIRYNTSKIFGKIILKPLYRRDPSSPRMTEQVQILKRRLECISRDLKVLWIALKCFQCI